MSGNPAKKAIYACVITSVEVLPEEVDLVGFTHPYWPGKIVLDAEDLGARPKVVEYADGPLTFRCEQIRIGIGEIEDGKATFAAGYDVIFRALSGGDAVRSGAVDAVHEFSDQVKAALEKVVTAEQFTRLSTSMNLIEQTLARERLRR